MDTNRNFELTQEELTTGLEILSEHMERNNFIIALETFSNTDDKLDNETFAEAVLRHLDETKMSMQDRMFVLESSVAILHSCRMDHPDVKEDVQELIDLKYDEIRGPLQFAFKKLFELADFNDDLVLTPSELREVFAALNLEYYDGAMQSMDIDE